MKRLNGNEEYILSDNQVFDILIPDLPHI